VKIRKLIGLTQAALALVFLFVLTTYIVLAAQAPPNLPRDWRPRQPVRQTDPEQRTLLKGLPVTSCSMRIRQRSRDLRRRVGQAPISRYLSAVKDIEQFEKGDNFLVTKRISGPIGRFRPAHSPKRLSDLKSCKPGCG
jgi:hypothetical protein